MAGTSRGYARICKEMKGHGDEKLRNAPEKL
uniref:Uncharacterized protein n=1 Tax=Ackermannviridae sp. TaxID=2831612 RepID=A0A8S5VXL8_9CAUD|nr:MAG TPA: hypothetical protein [Ackermannviridae sp.]